MKNIYERGNTDWYADLFKDFENNLNGRSTTKFHQGRQQALETFLRMGFPTTRHEEWRYTNVAPLLKYDFKLSTPLSGNQLSKNDIDNFIFKDTEYPLLVFVNGHFMPGLSNTGNLKDQLEVMNLDQAIEINHPALKDHYSKYALTDAESFVSFNSAFVQDGALINIPDNHVCEKPIHLLYLTLPDKKPMVSIPRNLIITGRSSQVSFIENYAALSPGTYFTNLVTEIYVGENSSVERIKIQNENAEAFHISALNVLQERDSRFVDHNLNIGSSISRNNISTIFNNQGGTSTLNGLYAGDNDQLLDSHTSIDHAFPNCESFELYKGILDKKSKGVFNGKIFVRPDAQKTNAIQSNNCILLSDDATIDTKPQLEIFADDVKCTHGATIGQLDEDAYFYMRARGINKDKARKLLIFAFASEVIDKIEHDPIRETITHLIENKLVQVQLD
jgi:Fe-S cluster assembly protein SufD